MSNGSPEVGPILITGGKGMLAAAWRKLLDSRGIDYTTPSENDLDITDPASVERHVTDNFPVVINCAAYTDVDGAETDTDKAEQINGEAVGILARRCSDVGALLVHYSTDYVFNGQASQPYAVGEPTDPGSGKVKRKRAFLRHILTSKTAKQKRKLRKAALVSDADRRRISALLPYG